jgi:hypothetical protein
MFSSVGGWRCPFDMQVAQVSVSVVGGYRIRNPLSFDSPDGGGEMLLIGVRISHLAARCRLLGKTHHVAVGEAYSVRT